jgi:uridine kinase
MSGHRGQVVASQPLGAEPVARRARGDVGLVSAAAPRLGRTRLVLVDGPSGAGKTFYAAGLAEALAEVGLSVSTVHTDDLLDGWDDQFTYWSRLDRQVLTPIRHGAPGGYHPYDWHLRRFGTEWTTVWPAGVVIVEGVGCGRAEGRAWASLTVYVHAPAAVRRARSIVRDGPSMQPVLREWRRREAIHFAADATAAQADLRIDGSA